MLRGRPSVVGIHISGLEKEPPVPSLSDLALALLVSGGPRYALGRWQHTSFPQEPTLRNTGQDILLCLTTTES